MTTEPKPFARPGRGTQPPYLYPDYASTVKRSPNRAPIRLEHTVSEVTGPFFADGWAGPDATDLTTQHPGAPLGERIIVEGRVLDEAGRSVVGTLIELWQCNAAGRYHHPVDQHDAPLDPNFTGAGQAVTNTEGEYRFLTIKPGAYPWRNSPNAWRPAHIHLAVFGMNGPISDAPANYVWIRSARLDFYRPVAVPGPLAKGGEVRRPF